MWKFSSVVSIVSVKLSKHPAENEWSGVWREGRK